MHLKGFYVIVVSNAEHFLSSREGIESILPSDVHEIAENRLYVSVTNSKSGENHLVSNFPSREDLIKVIMLNMEVVNKNAGVFSRFKSILLIVQ